MGAILLSVGLFLVAFASTGAKAADDLRRAPPAFAYQNGKAIPVDFKHVDLEMTFDYASKTVLAEAEIEFFAEQAGYPFMDMLPAATTITLNNVAIAPTAFPQIRDPQQVTYLRVLQAEVGANTTNHLRITYKLPASEVSFDKDGAVSAGFFMSDLAESGREFWEQFAPSNLEFDQFEQVMTVRVTGTQKRHEIFVNGGVEVLGDRAWRIRYPSYFTTSSFYFHLAPTGKYAVRGNNYTSIDGRAVPVVAYAATADLASRGLNSSLKILAELEQTYGAYPHFHGLVAYMTSTGGGMEHCGATITSMSALAHEITHSWFARGVMPANGNAGWIDEATASWRDGGYVRARGEPNRSPVNLGGFAPFRRHTAMASYSSGKTLMTEFDYMFRDFGFEGQTGMRAVLRKLFSIKQRQTITVGFFHQFLEDTTGFDLDAIFERYVYGRGSRSKQDGDDAALASLTVVAEKSTHPRPFTKAERLSLR